MASASLTWVEEQVSSLLQTTIFICIDEEATSSTLVHDQSSPDLILGIQYQIIVGLPEKKQSKLGTVHARTFQDFDSCRESI